MATTRTEIPNPIQDAIVRVRGLNVMLDADLAALYGVSTRALNQAVRRNRQRFPSDFAFRLTATESLRSQTVISNAPAPKSSLRSQSVTLKASADGASLRSQSVILKPGRGTHRKYPPYAFTEQGVAMLSSVLRSPRAIAVNIEIMRAFVQLRRMLDSNAELARKLADLERKFDGQFKVVFEAIRQLMAPPAPTAKRIGFRRER